MQHGIQNCVSEWAHHSGKAYADPFNEVELDVLFTDPRGLEHRVPAFWAGGQTWRVRYSSQLVGRQTYRTICSDQDNPDLHGQVGEIEITPYEGDNPLLTHGALRVAANRRYLEHADGTPFFWLGDTWWLSLCRRLRWPGDFKELVADRVQKGFNVVQLVAGLFPDQAGFDERGANEAGFPWEPDYARINPAFFDMADLRLDWLVAQGVMPCLLGCWGYYVLWLGVDKMKQHWRYLVARYGAYPLVWCLAGEGIMSWYLSPDRTADSARQKDAWTEVARYVRELDPYHRLITIHPTVSARDQVHDDSLLDFDMLQTGHGDRRSMKPTVDHVTAARIRTPVMPVINGEVTYEGICGQNREEVVRYMFWASVLSGTCGHTYGANGIWQVNREEQPYGPSPHGTGWGDTPWREAAQLPGSGQLGLAGRLLKRYEWWRFEPHQEWVDAPRTESDYEFPFAAGIPGEVRLVYIPVARPAGALVHGLERDIAYRAYYVNVLDGTETDLGRVEPDEAGNWQSPKTHIRQDWVLVLERAD